MNECQSFMTSKALKDSANAIQVRKSSVVHCATTQARLQNAVRAVSRVCLFDIGDVRQSLHILFGTHELVPPCVVQNGSSLYPLLRPSAPSSVSEHLSSRAKQQSCFAHDAPEWRTVTALPLPSSLLSCAVPRSKMLRETQLRLFHWPV